MKRWLVLVAVLVSVGCSAHVAGDPVGAGTPAATVESTEDSPTTAEPTAEDPATDGSTTADAPSPAAPPTAIDPNAPARYCDGTITGALGKSMNVVVVETPSGRVNCDQAGAVLVDYYAQRPDPGPGSAPIVVGTFACNQVPVPDQPQVICADGASLFYSMWVQGG
jgi:hypothetical protein